MTTRYENKCDICGKITKSLDCTNNWSDPEYAKNNWDIRVYNNWLEDRPGGASELLSSVEVGLDACLDCAKRISEIIKKEVRRQ